MSPRARKTLNLSLISLALAGIHFYIASLFWSLHSGVSLIGTAIFGLLGLFQTGLSALGFKAARRQ